MEKETFLFSFFSFFSFLFVCLFFFFFFCYHEDCGGMCLFIAIEKKFPSYTLLFSTGGSFFSSSH